MKRLYCLSFIFVFCFIMFYTYELFAQEKPEIIQETINVGSKVLKYIEERSDNYFKKTITIPSSSLDDAYNVLKEYYDTNNRQDVYYKIGRLIEIFGQLNPVLNSNNEVLDMSTATIVMYKYSNTELEFEISDSETDLTWLYNMKCLDKKTTLTIRSN